jgi:hypothetical protein
MGTALDVGLLTGVLSLAREPVRLTLRVWEFGLSSAAEAARLGLELVDPGRSGSSDFADYRAGSHPAQRENGAAPEVVVVPETDFRVPESGEVGPKPDVLDVEDAPPAPADVPPAVPDELIPDHIDEEPVLVAEAAEEGAEDGAGPELHIDPPWDGYDKMTAADIRDRLSDAPPAVAAAVELYESTKKSRSSVLAAAERALKA